jgi:hypothetical protein
LDVRTIVSSDTSASFSAIDLTTGSVQRLSSRFTLLMAGFAVVESEVRNRIYTKIRTGSCKDMYCWRSAFCSIRFSPTVLGGVARLGRYSGQRFLRHERKRCCRIVSPTVPQKQLLIILPLFLAVESRPDGIRVNCVLPWFTRTEMVKRVL